MTDDTFVLIEGLLEVMDMVPSRRALEIKTRHLGREAPCALQRPHGHPTANSAAANAGGAHCCLFVIAEEAEEWQASRPRID